jgi:hypothetical protein
MLRRSSTGTLFACTPAATCCKPVVRPCATHPLISVNWLVGWICALQLLRPHDGGEADASTTGGGKGAAEKCDELWDLLRFTTLQAYTNRPTTLSCAVDLERSFHLVEIGEVERAVGLLSTLLHTLPHSEDSISHG